MNITAEEKLKELIKNVSYMVETHLMVAEESLDFSRKNNLTLRSAMDEEAKAHALQLKSRWKDIKYQYEK